MIAIKMAALSQFFGTFCLFLMFSSFLDLIIPCYSVERKITSKIYNNCSSLHNNASISIMYVSAEDVKQKNAVQFIWSVFETPSIIVAYTSKITNDQNQKFGLEIDCKNLLKGAKGSINFSVPYDYIVAFEISELREFNDPEDTVTFAIKDFKVKSHIHSINKTNWEKPEIQGDSIAFLGRFLNGNISFQCQPAKRDGRDSKAPRQLYSSNGTRFTIALTNLKLNTTFPRIALKLLTHTMTKVQDKTCVMEDQSIDDEFSPGVFRTFVINNTFQTHHGFSSAISWKPVSYNDEPRELKTQVPSYQYLYDSNSEYPHSKVTTDCRQTLVPSKDLPSKVIQATMGGVKTYPMMVSFGQNKDGWYQGHLIWSGQIAFGKPRFDTISTTVLITIIVGLGLPFFFIMVGSIYICVKKYKERMTTSTYGKIN